MLELQGSMAGLIAQEETLRLQQAGIREHLAVGCKSALGPLNPPHAEDTAIAYQAEQLQEDAVAAPKEEP